MSAYFERHRGAYYDHLLTTIDHLFARPVTDIRELEGALGISFESARRLVALLEREGVLEEITGSRRNRVYAAREIVRVLQGSLDEK